MTTNDPILVTFVKPKPKPRWWQVHTGELLVIAWCFLMIVMVANNG